MINEFVEPGNKMALIITTNYVYCIVYVNVKYYYLLHITDVGNYILLAVG